MKSWALAILAAGALGLVACDGNGDNSEKNFSASADQICTKTTRGVIDSNLRAGNARTHEQQIEQIEVQLPVREQGQAKLRQLQAPEAEREQFARFVELRAEQIDAQRKEAEAFNKGDRNASARANEEAGAAQAASLRIAARLGFEACALELPADDTKVAKAIIKEFETTANPNPKRVCRDLVTPQYLESSFRGSFEVCARFTRERADDFFAKDVMFNSVIGVDNLAAIVDYQPIGGHFDGVPTRGTLYYLDGRWQIFELSE